ncbi:MAG TPA: 16S rRNA (uracil(1498)-N(3))-methyltransferase [Alphaproteobacteria bacterium]|nr:16S rRNA (uracil(1498)-N(3))-methyltransferase [Alphaproteobacteria bacterium]
MPTVRLYVSDDLTGGGAASLGAKQAHYLKAVMRLGAGEDILVFNGRDGEWRGQIADLGKKGGAISVVAQTREQHFGPDLWLAFAPVKRGKPELVARAATELGVSVLQPVTTRRTVVGRVNTERLRANAVEAAEQCGRLTVPAVLEPVALEALMDQWPPDRRLMLCDETGGGQPVATALAQDPRTTPWAVLIGPEGGFDPSELDALGKHPIVTRVGLGPRILRAETAAIAALACWQVLVGDWRALE